ncbi:MAG: YncE family protein, partial [Acidobacteriales bacterium]|nr:YncE family protein [Terriglobales bacterium]
MKALFRAAVPVACLCLSGLLFGQGGQGRSSASLLVLSKQAHSLNVVDASSLKVVAKVPVGNDPHEVIASDDGSTAFVSNYGFGAYNTLTVVDLRTDKPLRTVDLGPLRGPHGLAFAQGKVWFTSEVAKAVARYDPATNKVDWILGTGQNRIHMIYVSRDAQRIVATNVISGTVSIIDKAPVRTPGPASGSRGMSSDWNQTVVRVGNGSEGFDVSPDEKEIWVANAKDGTISIINFQEKKVVQTVAANLPGANRLKFTPDGKHVLVSSGPILAVLDASTRKVITRIPIGHGSGCV